MVQMRNKIHTDETGRLLDDYEVATWRQRARCTPADTDLFFANENQRTNIEQAKALCGACAVKNLCLSWATDNDEKFGIWGGATARERGHKTPSEIIAETPETPDLLAIEAPKPNEDDDILDADSWFDDEPALEDLTPDTDLIDTAYQDVLAVYGVPMKAIKGKE